MLLEFFSHHDGEPELLHALELCASACPGIVDRRPADICYTAAELAMIDPKNFEQIIDSLRQSMPGGLAQNVEKNLRAALSAAFTRLNLVTREELEVQAAVLARTRARLEVLEKQVAELEKALLKK